MANQEWRVTFHVVRSGQPRPYADSEYVAMLCFECKTPYGPAETRNTYLPQMVSEERARQAARSFFGYIDVTAKERKHGLDPYLDYFKPVEPKYIDRFGRECSSGELGDAELRASTWTFRTVTPFTD